jgi:hypothetical protein
MTRHHPTKSRTQLHSMLSLQQRALPKVFLGHLDFTECLVLIGHGAEAVSAPFREDVWT